MNRFLRFEELGSFALGLAGAIDLRATSEVLKARHLARMAELELEHQKFYSALAATRKAPSIEDPAESLNRDLKRVVSELNRSFLTCALPYA